MTALIGWVTWANVVHVTLAFLLSTPPPANATNAAQQVTSPARNNEFPSRLKRSTDDGSSSSASQSTSPSDPLQLDGGWSPFTSLDVLKEEAGKRGGRVQQGFVGMRGKKEEEDFRDTKRNTFRPSRDNFYGMRGKKYREQRKSRGGGEAFYGMRGRRTFQLDTKRIPSNGFFGMRGKKEDEDEEDVEALEEEPFDGDVKRSDVRNRFLGMRGKRSFWPASTGVKGGGGGHGGQASLFRPNFPLQKKKNFVDHVFIGMRG